MTHRTHEILAAIRLIQALGNGISICMPCPSGGWMDVENPQDVVDYLADRERFFARFNGQPIALLLAWEEWLAGGFRCIGTTLAGQQCRAIPRPNYSERPMRDFFNRVSDCRDFSDLLCRHHKVQAARIQRAYESAVEVNS